MATDPLLRGLRYYFRLAGDGRNSAPPAALAQVPPATPEEAYPEAYSAAGLVNGIMQVRTPRASAPPSATKATVACFLTPPGPRGGPRAVGWQNGLRLVLGVDGGLAVWVNGEQMRAGVAGEVPVGARTHVAATWLPSGAWAFSKNGALVASGAAASLPAGDFLNTLFVVQAGDDDGSPAVAHVYGSDDAAQPAAEVARLYNSGVGFDPTA